jgi:hypothetical protein
MADHADIADDIVKGIAVAAISEVQRLSDMSSIMLSRTSLSMLAQGCLQAIARAEAAEDERDALLGALGSVSLFRRAEAAEASLKTEMELGEQWRKERLAAEAERDRLKEALWEARDWIAEDYDPRADTYPDYQAALLNRLDAALEATE